MLEKQNAVLLQKTEDAENRSRALNLQFIHVPEWAEGTDTIGFIVRLLATLFSEASFSTPPVIERAHRSPGASSKRNSKAGPRPILAKFLYFLTNIKSSASLGRKRSWCTKALEFSFIPTSATVWRRNAACLTQWKRNCARWGSATRCCILLPSGSTSVMKLTSATLQTKWRCLFGMFRLSHPSLGLSWFAFLLILWTL